MNEFADMKFEFLKSRNVSITIDREKDFWLAVESRMKSYYSTESAGVEPIYSEKFFRKARGNCGN